jgi:hypothetical protein
MYNGVSVGSVSLMVIMDHNNCMLYSHSISPTSSRYSNNSYHPFSTTHHSRAALRLTAVGNIRVSASIMGGRVSGCTAMAMGHMALFSSMASLRGEAGRMAMGHSMALVSSMASGEAGHMAMGRSMGLVSTRASGQGGNTAMGHSMVSSKAAGMD